jgi:hypothetical protein
MRKLTLVPLVLTLLALTVYVNGWRAWDIHNADFAAFYSGGILWGDGRPAYDLKAACDLQAQVGVSLCMPFFHPPVLLPLLSAIANGDYAASYLRWFGLLLVVILCCAFPVYALTDRDLPKTIVLICFFPMFVILLQGQDTAFVLLGVLLCAVFLRGGKDSLAGIALGLTVLRPHLALALSMPLLFSRPKAFRSFFITGMVLVVYSFALVGVEGFRDIVSTTLLSARGTDASTHQQHMFNLVGLIARRGLNPIWAWPFFIGSIAGISVLWNKRGVTQSTFALGIICALFTSPHLHMHDLALLIIPLLAWPAVTVPIISFGMLTALSFGVTPLFIYAIMLGLALTVISQGGLWKGATPQIRDRNPTVAEL